MPFNRPDITFMNKKTKNTFLIDIALPNTHNLAKTITDKQVPRIVEWNMWYVEAKGSTSDPVSNIIYGSNSKVTVTKSNNTLLAPQYVYTTAKICNSWHMFNCKKLLKLQVRPPSLILLITASQDRWIFHSQSWEVKNSIIIIIIIIILNINKNKWRYARMLNVQPCSAACICG